MELNASGQIKANIETLVANYKSQSSAEALTLPLPPLLTTTGPTLPPASRKPRAKRATFTLKEKMALITESMQPGYSQVQAAARHGIKQSTLSGILKNKDKILAVTTLRLGNSKNVSHGKEHELEQRLFEWFVQTSAQGVQLSKSSLRTHAKEMAASMNLDTKLKFTNGWLCNFRRRYGIDFVDDPDEEVGKDAASFDSWCRDVMPGLLDEYGQSGIYHCQETSINYKQMPNTRLLSPGDDEPVKSKNPRDRFTILVTTSIDGSDKLPLLAIGKGDQPGEYPAKVDAIPVHYESSSSLWMTPAIWIKFIKDWDVQLRHQGRKALLLASKAPSHPEVHDLTNLRIIHLPSNAANPIQLCDATLVHNLKGFYQSELTRAIMAMLETSSPDVKASSMAKNVSVSDAICMLGRAWSCVKPVIIRNSFRKIFGTDEDDTGAQDPLNPSSYPSASDANGLGTIVQQEDFGMDIIKHEYEDVQTGENEDGGHYDEQQVGWDDVGPMECLQALSVIRGYCQSRNFDNSVHDTLQMIENNCLAQCESSATEDQSNATTDLY